MRKVVVESPYNSKDLAIIERNTAYARACLHDCFLQGDAPFASHLLYTQPGILRDGVPEERALGIEAGLLWVQTAEATVVYTDFDITPGMQKGIDRATSENRPIEYRTLPPDSWFFKNYPKR